MKRVMGELMMFFSFLLANLRQGSKGNGNVVLKRERFFKRWQKKNIEGVEVLQGC